MNKSRPFERKVENFLNIFNEAGVLVVTILMMAFVRAEAGIG
jgi:hypothetical protein